MKYKYEKCYFCDKEALYTQPYQFAIVYVCKTHFSMALSS